MTFHILSYIAAFFTGSLVVMGAQKFLAAKIRNEKQQLKEEPQNLSELLGQLSNEMPNEPVKYIWFTLNDGRQIELANTGFYIVNNANALTHQPTYIGFNPEHKPICGGNQLAQVKTVLIDFADEREEFAPKEAPLFTKLSSIYGKKTPGI